MTIKTLRVVNLKLISIVLISLMFGTIAAINLYLIARSPEKIPTKLIVWGNDARNRFKLDSGQHYFFSGTTEFLFRTGSQSGKQPE